MKNMKLYNTVKRIMGGTKITIASIAGASTLLFVGCNKEVVEDNTEVVVEQPVAEEPEIEIIETSEPVEEVKEESVKPEKIELNLADGEEYQVEKISAEDVYVQIDSLEQLANDKYSGDYDFDFKRDNMIATYCMVNYDSIDKSVIDELTADYLVNWSGDDFSRAYKYLYDDEDIKDANLIVDPVYQNEMDLFNYYLGLYAETNSDEYYDIIKSALYGNEYDIFPLTFNDNSNSNLAIYELMKTKMEVYLTNAETDKYEDYIEFVYMGDAQVVTTNSYITFNENANSVALSADTYIADPASYVSPHKSKIK